MKNKSLRVVMDNAEGILGDLQGHGTEYKNPSRLDEKTKKLPISGWPQRSEKTTEKLRPLSCSGHFPNLSAFSSDPNILGKTDIFKELRVKNRILAVFAAKLEGR